MSDRLRQQFGFSLFLGFLVTFLLGVLLGLLFSPPKGWRAVLVVAQIPMLAWCLWQMDRRQLEWCAMIGDWHVWQHWRWLGWIPLSLCFSALVTIGLLVIGEKIFPGWFDAWAAAQNSVDFNSWGGFFSVVICAPLIEELLFRGLILQRLMTRIDKRIAVVLSALIFALMHWSPFMPIQFVGGLTLALAYLHTRSLLVPVIMHGAWNFMVTQLPDKGIEARGAAGLLALFATHAVWLLPLAIAGTVVLLLALKRLWPGEDQPLPYAENAAMLTIAAK